MQTNQSLHFASNKPFPVNFALLFGFDRIKIKITFLF